MNSLVSVLITKPIILVHVLCALSSLLLGIRMLMGTKGNTTHRRLGWLWVGLMAGTTTTSVFIRDHGLINIAGYTPIHLLTLLTAVMLFGGIRAIRRNDVSRHRKTMTSLFWGACVVAGAFTLLPNRILGNWLWRGVLGLSV